VLIQEGGEGGRFRSGKAKMKSLQATRGGFSETIMKLTTGGTRRKSAVSHTQVVGEGKKTEKSGESPCAPYQYSSRSVQEGSHMKSKGEGDVGTNQGLGVKSSQKGNRGSEDPKKPPAG